MFARMVCPALLVALLLLPIVAPFAPPAQAHAPRLHKARMVAFNPPPPAPGFSLPDLEGNPVRLADLRGKYVLLNFWATWCPPCVREMPTMERLAQQMADAPFTVLAVSLDDEGAAKVRPFIERLGVTFPIALDPESKVSGVYGARDLPATFVIDPQGRVVAAAKGERDWAAPEMLDYFNELIASRE